MVEVTLWGSLAAAAEGNSKVEIEAKDIRELFKKLTERFPGLEPLMERGGQQHQAVARPRWSTVASFLFNAS